MIQEYGAVGGMKIDRRNCSIQRQPTPKPLHLYKDWDRNPPAAMGNCCTVMKITPYVEVVSVRLSLCDLISAQKTVGQLFYSTKEVFIIIGRTIFMFICAGPL